MVNSIYIEKSRFYIENDSTLIRDKEDYSLIKDNINKRIGKTNWEEIQRLAESLAKDSGIDLVIACYYTVATFKVKGIQGFANGLSLINCCLLSEPQFSSKQKRTNKDLIDWVTSKTLKEIKSLKIGSELLSDLYRCERECQNLEDFLEKQQAQEKPNIDGITFEITKRLNKLEAPYLNKSGILFSKKNPVSKIIRYFLLLLVGGAIGGSALKYLPEFLQQHQPDFKVQQPYPNLLGEEQLSYFSHFYGESEHLQMKQQLIDLYLNTFNSKRYGAMVNDKKDARKILNVLQTLYPNEPAVIEANLSLVSQENNAQANNQRFLSSFKEARTNAVNLSALTKKVRWKLLQEKAKSVEDFAISLSPIYARALYIEESIQKGNVTTAKKQLNELITRMEYLSWKIIELEEQIEAVSK